MSEHPANDIQRLIEKLADKRRIWVLTGAGISAASGIPTYRNHKGEWQAAQPVQHNDFITQLAARQRYWARSAVGWQPVHIFAANVECPTRFGVCRKPTESGVRFKVRGDARLSRPTVITHSKLLGSTPPPVKL